MVACRTIMIKLVALFCPHLCYLMSFIHLMLCNYYLISIMIMLYYVTILYMQFIAVDDNDEMTFSTNQCLYNLANQLGLCCQYIYSIMAVIKTFPTISYYCNFIHLPVAMSVCCKNNYLNLSSLETISPRFLCRLTALIILLQPFNDRG